MCERNYMKIEALKSYKVKGTKTNFGVKGDEKKQENYQSKPFSSKVSTVKMLPVLMAMAGMQPAAATPNTISPNPIVTEVSGYDPQYDGRSKYLNMNLNELYFYAFQERRSPRFIDMNELFDLYIDGRINWNKVKNQFNFSDFEMGQVQNGIKYFNDLYILKEYEKAEAIASGRITKEQYEARERNKPRERAHYRTMDFVTNAAAVYANAVSASDLRPTEAMLTATMLPPSLAAVKVSALKDEEKRRNTRIETDDSGSSSRDLKYAGTVPNNLDPGGAENVIKFALDGLAVNQALIDDAIRRAEEERNAANSSQNKVNSQTQNKEQIPPEVNKLLPKYVESELPDKEVYFSANLYSDLQRLAFGIGLKSGNVEVLSQKSGNVRFKADMKLSSGILNLDSSSPRANFIKGTLTGNSSSRIPGRKTEVYAQFDKEGAMKFAILKQLTNNKIYEAHLIEDGTLNVVDLTDEGEGLSLQDLGALVNEVIDNPEQYIPSNDDDISDEEWEETIDFFLNHGKESSESEEIESKSSVESKEQETSSNMNQIKELFARMDSINKVEKEQEEKLLAEKKQRALQNNEAIKSQYALTSDALDNIENYFASEEENDDDSSLPLAFSLTALGGIAAGAGGKKLFDMIKNGEIDLDKIKSKLLNKKNTDQNNKSTINNNSEKNINSNDDYDYESYASY